MKIMNKSFEIIWVLVCLMIAVIIGLTIVINDDGKIEKNGYEIVSENIYDNIAEIVVRKDGDEYVIQYLADDLKALVCHNEQYSYAEIEREYDCSTPEKINRAMFDELFIQSLDTMEEE